MKTILILSLLFLFALPSQARNSIDYLNFASQTEFRQFAVDLSGILASQTLETAEPLTLQGFDLGLGFNYSKFRYQKMNQVSDHGHAYIESAQISLTKGLPYRLNIGLHTTQTVHLQTLGARLGWTLWQDATTHISWVGFYDKLLNSDQIHYQDYGSDLVFSKRYLNVTPFLILGVINSETDPVSQNEQPIQLNQQKTIIYKETLGFRVNNMNWDYFFAAGQIHGTLNFQFKLGYRF